MKKQTFLRGAFTLMIAGMVTKILGVINKIVLARIVGEEGVGLYMMAYPTLLLTVTLTQLGLPVAISKMVAEAAAYNDRRKIKRVLTVSFVTVGTLSIIFTVVLMLGAPAISSFLFTDERTLYPLMAIAPIVPIVGVASVLRGYFQGMQNMSPYAYSQVIEQIIRISLVATLTNALLPYGVAFAAGGAMISGVIGEFVSLCYMLWMFKSKKKVQIRKGFWTYLSGSRQIFSQLMRIALPTTGTRLIGSISYFLEPIIVAQSLFLAGVATKLATQQYGALVGFAIPLLGMPGFITHALHVSLIPTVSESAAQGRMDIVYFRLNQALKIALIAGGFSMVIAYVFGEALLDLMYHSPGSAVYIYVLAPFFLFLYFQSPLSATLQALDLAKNAMINNLIGAVIKILVIFALASKPEFGIMGVALGFAVGYILVTLLHLGTIIKATDFSLNASDFIKGGLTLVITGVLAKLADDYLLIHWHLLSRTLTLICCISIFYLLLMIITRLITKEELRHFPIIGKWVT